MAGFPKIRRFAATAALAALLPAIALQIAFAADPDLLGYAALLDEAQVKERLNLTSEQEEQAATLLRERENEAVKAALQMRDLPEAEQYAKLAPVIAESERLAREMLDETQRKEFDRIRVSRKGPSALTEAETSVQFALTEEQRQQVETIVAERTAAVAEAAPAQRATVGAPFDERLLGLLTAEQRQQWDAFVGAPEDDGAPAVASENPRTGNPASGSTPLPRIPTPDQQMAEEAGNGRAADVVERLENVRLTLSFRDTPWASVIDWLAERAGLSLNMAAPPAGTVNYVDPQPYTLGQTLDLLNGLLQTEGYRLILKGRMLILVNLQDPIPPTLIDTVAPEDLDARGRYELLRTTFKVRALPIEQAVEAVAALIGQEGTYIGLPSSGQIIVTASGLKLLDIREFLAEVEGTRAGGGFSAIELEHRIADELMLTIRPLLGIAEGAFATPDDSLRIAPDPSGTKFLVSGTPQSVDRFTSIVEALDVPDVAGAGAASTGAPYLDSYPAGAGDPQLTLKVLQTLLAGSSDEVRMELNEGNGTIVLLARPAQHETAKAALGLLDRDPRQVEVINLRIVDPTRAMDAINLLFGARPAAPAAPAANGQPAAAAPVASNAPVVVADTLNAMLFVRGTDAQIAQIKQLLQKMGEVETDGDYASDRGNMRIIPGLTGRQAQGAVSQLQAVWPSVRENRIRVVTPSELSNERLPGGSIDERRSYAPGGSSTGASGASGPPAMNGAAGGMNGSLPAGFDPAAFGPRPGGPSGAGPERASALTIPRELAEQLTPEQIQQLQNLGVDPAVFEELGVPLPNLPLPGANGLTPNRLPPPPIPAPAPNEPAASEPEASLEAPASDRSAGHRLPRGVNVQFVSLQETQPSEQPDAGSPTPQPGEPAPQSGEPVEESAPEEPNPADAFDSAEEPATDEPAGDESAEEPGEQGPPAEVIVSVTPNGIVIASKDARTLDDIENFLNQIATATPLGPQYTIFYLKHETASAAKQILEQALTGETDSGGDAGGGLLGDIASQAMADVGGGLLGGLLGDSGTSTASGEFVIVANDRLNALFVQANPMDLEMIEDLLTIVDRERSPEEVLTAGTTRVIKLVNLKAPAVADHVKAVFADRMEQGGKGGQGGRGGGGGPSPEDFIPAIAAGGGRGGRGGAGGGGGAAPEPPKMTVSADEASNSLIVRAPEPLLSEVERLVKDLDAGAQAETSETMQVVHMRHAAVSSIQASLESILGDQATITSSGPTTTDTNNTSGGSSGGSSRPSSSSGGDSNRSSNDDDARRRAFFDAIRQSQQRGGGGPPGGGGGPPGFPGGGFPGGGRGR